MTAVLIVLICMTLPLSAVAALTYLGAVRARAKADSVDKKLLEKLLDENKALRDRVENLETIVTSDDWERRLRLPDPVGEAQAEEVPVKAEAVARS